MGCCPLTNNSGTANIESTDSQMQIFLYFLKNKDKKNNKRVMNTVCDAFAES